MLLLVALWVLLVPERLGTRLLAAAAPFWTALLLTWLLAAYGVTALAPVRQLPPVAHSIGLYAFGRRGPPLGPLLGMLLAAVALAGLERSRLRPAAARCACGTFADSCQAIFASDRASRTHPAGAEAKQTSAAYLALAKTVWQWQRLFRAAHRDEAGREAPQDVSPSHQRLTVQGSRQWDRLQAAIQLVVSPATGLAGASPRGSATGGTAGQPLLRGHSADSIPEDEVCRTIHAVLFLLLQSLVNALLMHSLIQSTLGL